MGVLLGVGCPLLYLIAGAGVARLYARRLWHRFHQHVTPWTWQSRDEATRVPFRWSMFGITVGWPLFTIGVGAAKLLALLGRFAEAPIQRDRDRHRNTWYELRRVADELAAAARVARTDDERDIIRTAQRANETAIRVHGPPADDR